MVTWVGLAVASNTVRINDVLKDRSELVGHVIGGRSLVGVNHVQYGRHSRTTPLLAHGHRQTHTYRPIYTHTYRVYKKTWQSI